MKSGEFARLCGTTKNTLIHYDDIGLLHPAEKGENRYRNYSVADLARFSVIRAMTQAGFSLAQVREMLDTPDPERLAALAHENTRALDERIAELRRSKRLLTEIGRLAYAAIGASSIPTVEECPERCLLVVEELDDLRIGGDWEDVISRDAAVMEVLATLGPEATVAPYGVTAEIGRDGLPEYREFFYVLPRKPRSVPIGALAPMPAGKYALVSYAGTWRGVGEAYRRLGVFIGEEALNVGAPWYEISQGRLLDTDKDHYRCTIFAPLGVRK